MNLRHRRAALSPRGSLGHSILLTPLVPALNAPDRPSDLNPVGQQVQTRSLNIPGRCHRPSRILNKERQSQDGEADLTLLVTRFG